MSATGAPRVALATLGCRVNFSDTDRLRGKLQQAGYCLVDFEQPADVYIVNTCTVTHVADRKSRQLLRRASRRNREALIVAVGCYAKTAPQALQQIQEVDLVIGSDQEPFLLEQLAAALQKRGREAPAVADAGPGPTVAPAHPARAIVKVQDGCDNHCAYCIVTVARGPSRSRPAEKVLAEVQALERQGHREIILTGINLGVYRDEHVHNLAGLTRSILQETRVGRIRFSSIEPQDFPLELLDLWPNTRLCRHFHLPLQSGCDRTLARMGRRYRLADLSALVTRIRRRIPDVALTTDVIVGFPGETEEMFIASMRAIADLHFSDLHVFPFSLRPGTAAASMPDQVPPALISERCREMHKLSRQMAQTFRRRFLGRELAVHWDGRRGREWSGLSDNYLRVVSTSAGDWLTQITPTHIERLEEAVLRGRILERVPRQSRASHTGQITDFVV